MAAAMMIRASVIAPLLTRSLAIHVAKTRLSTCVHTCTGS
jgi:hypothetical protein